jgi:hypothetical protein
VAANGGEQRGELSAIEFFLSSFGPRTSARRGGAIESFAELTEVLLGMKAVDNLDRSGEQFRDEIPDPGSSSSERRGTRSLREAAALGLAPDPLSKGRTLLSTVRGGGTFNGRRIGDGSFITDRGAVAAERFRAPDRAEFDFPCFRATLGLTGHAGQFLGTQGDPGSIDAQVQRLGQRKSVERFAVLALVFGDFLTQGFGSTFHPFSIHGYPGQFLQ